MSRFTTTPSKSVLTSVAIAAALAIPLVGANAALAADAYFPPTAVDDEYFAPQDQDTLFGGVGVIGNDFASDGGQLLIDVLSLPSSGQILGLSSTGYFTFRPDPGFVGDVTFTYDIKDTESGMASNTANVVIHVTPAPVLPVANPDSYSTPMGVPLVVDAASGLLANDVDAVSENFSDEAQNEVLVQSDGSFVYTPAAGFIGTKTFSYTMTDGTNTSNLALVTIEVTGPAISVIPSNPIPHDPGTPDGGSTTGELPTLAYTGAVTSWMLAPALALLALGAGAVAFAARRRRAL